MMSAVGTRASWSARGLPADSRWAAMEADRETAERVEREARERCEAEAADWTRRSLEGPRAAAGERPADQASSGPPAHSHERAVTGQRGRAFARTRTRDDGRAHLARMRGRRTSERRIRTNARLRYGRRSAFARTRGRGINPWARAGYEWRTGNHERLRPGAPLTRGEPSGSDSKCSSWRVLTPAQGAGLEPRRAGVRNRYERRHRHSRLSRHLLTPRTGPRQPVSVSRWTRRAARRRIDVRARGR